MVFFRKLSQYIFDSFCNENLAFSLKIPSDNISHNSIKVIMLQKSPLSLKYRKNTSQPTDWLLSEK